MGDMSDADNNKPALGGIIGCASIFDSPKVALAQNHVINDVKKPSVMAG